MKLSKKLLAVLLALVIACSMLTTTVFAANGERYSVTSSTMATHNQQVEARKLALNDKFGISITYPTYTLDGIEVAAIYPETLDTLEMALDNVSAYLVRQVSSHYYNKNGKRLRIAYRFSDLGYSSVNDSIVRGGFDVNEAMIELFIPRPGQGAAATGDEPLTIVHEFGHALHMMLQEKYGESRLESEWKAFNSGLGYSLANGAANPSDTVFVSAYAATMYEEDFAETFAHVFVRGRAGMGFSGKLSANGVYTGLGNKVRFLETLLKTYFPDATTMQNNYAKIYTAANSATYNGITVSGSRLQYMGYAEPRYMPLATINELNFNDDHFRWLSAIGAWVAPAAAGGTIIVFTDGTWAKSAQNLVS